MSQVAVQPFSGTYRAATEPSSFAFAIRHSGTFWFRGSFAEVSATLAAGDHGPVLEGAAEVRSISVFEPEAMRTSVLGAEFFDAERHPQVRFRSTDISFAADGTVELEGELTMRGITRPVAASGTYAAPRPSSFGEIAGFELHATIDRRDFGFDWQATTPDGADAVGWEVELAIDLLLIKE
jgi:polyisoprenoid-binding protein YceI